MKADLTRQTFRAERHYAGTLQQQGRVPMDADWNEQVAIQLHHDESETIDVVGATGVPKGTSFQVDALSGDLQLSPGRAYVDGILCELDGGTVPVTVSGAGTLTPLTWTVDGLPLRLGEWVQISSTASDGKTYRITAMSPATLVLTLGVGADNLSTLFAGKTPVLRRVVTYMVQPEWWQPAYTNWPANAVPTLALPAPGIYLAYLDVWRRHVTALEDAGMREIALGGPDTCTRMRTTWQLKLAQAGALTDPITCDSTTLPATTSTGQLSARALLPGDDSPCVLAPTARYRSLENQLYRVEIHDGGALGAATFKFSADNGTVVSSWLKQDGLNLYVASTGKDSVLGFATGDWVEIIDDSHELAGEPGVMTQLTDVQPDYVSIGDNSILIGNFPLNPRIRKWDAEKATVIQSGADGFLTLGTAGVQIKFEAGNYSTGDYWLIPARTISTDVEWPKSELGTPLPRPRFGIQHHYMKLGLVTWDGQTFTTHDCRPQFPPLTDIHASDVKMDPGPCQFPPTVKTVQDAISALCQEKSNACCELVIAPGEDVRVAVDAAMQRNAALGIRGLHICFAAGTHTLRTTLTITAPAGGGDLTVTGCGLASHVIAPSEPIAIELVGWTTATVMDLNIAAGAVRGRVTEAAPVETSTPRTNPIETMPRRDVFAAPAAAATAAALGTLTLRDCAYGVVERVWSLCPPFPRRVTSCIAVSATQPAARASVRVTHCELAVGNHQVGVLVNNMELTTIEGNRIQVVPFAARESEATRTSHEYQGMLRDRLMSNLRIGTAAGHTVATEADERRVHFALNNVKMAFTADAAVAGAWSGYLARHAPHYLAKATRHQAVASPATDATGGAAAKNPVPNATSARVAMAMKRLATSIARKLTTLTQAQAQAMNIGEFYTYGQAQAQALAPAMASAILIGGAIAGDLRIVDNVISGAINGIRAALTRTTGAARITPRIVRARIASNTVVLGAPRGIHGIGIGITGCSSTVIEDNYVTHSGAGVSVGIAVLGQLGKMMRAEGNHVISTTVGILVRPPKATSGNDPSQGALWILSQNACINTTTPILAPTPPVVRINNAP
jgi:hypothetical protein